MTDMNSTMHSDMKFSRILSCLRPLSFRILLVGHILIVVALCDFAARLHAGSSVEPLLYMPEFMRSVATSAVVLWGAALGLDLWDRRDGGYTS